MANVRNHHRETSAWKTESVIGEVRKMIEIKKKYLERGVENEHVFISPVNSKGAPASVSTIPGHDCPNCKSCLRDCYDLRHDTIMMTVKRTRARNSAIFEADPIRFFDEISCFCRTQTSFRYNVGGDIKNALYFEQVVRVCKENPHCRFHIFTKNDRVVNEWIANNGGSKNCLPENLVLRLSEWVGKNTKNHYGLNLCSVFSKDEFIEVHDNEAICSGNCTNCFVHTTGCFNININRIYIQKH